MTKFDENAYNAGRKQFRKGGTFRAIFEPIMTADPTKPKTAKQRDDEESQQLSSVIGFFDELLDHLRKR